MAKRKKQSKIEVSLQELQGALGQFDRDLESFRSETRFNAAASRDVTSAQTDRIGKLNGIIDQAMRQTNAGFSQTKADLQRAGQGLNAHEREIATLTQRVAALEAAASVKPKGKR